MEYEIKNRLDFFESILYHYRIRKGSAKEEYSLPLTRERNPLAERFLEGRNEEGSFETGIRNVDNILVGIHASSPLTDKALLGAY